jgi:hypothetical protein
VQTKWVAFSSVGKAFDVILQVCVDCNGFSCWRPFPILTSVYQLCRQHN